MPGARSDNLCCQLLNSTFSTSKVNAFFASSCNVIITYVASMRLSSTLATLAACEIEASALAS